MKKRLLLFIMLCVAHIGFAQVKVNSAYGIYVDNESLAYSNFNYGVYVNNSTGGYAGYGCGFYANNTGGGYSKTFYGLRAINTNTSTFGTTMAPIFLLQA